ncbi:MAG: sulfite exporter TauE/SafE family protein [Candidatus Thermoplasmatota archaeon]|nr:sulfite exporter TauE/SafE family protein [Candidatus Thermoplasmatota archaeon]
MHHDPFTVIVFFIAGALISTLGAMTGLGGGFLCVPFLIIVWGRDRSEAVLTSLTMIVANSISSSITYFRSKMVDLRVFALLIVPTIPGLFIGYFLLESMEDAVFDIIFSILLILVTMFILIKNTRKKASTSGGREKRKLLPHISVPIAFATGTASSTFGIGGGALLMPLQVGLLKMNVKRAIATSMFLLAFMSTFRVFVISGGAFDPFMALPLAAGAVLGAQGGAKIVKKLKGKYLLYVLSLFLFLIAVFMLVGAVPDVF